MAKEIKAGVWACEHKGCNYTSDKKGWTENHERNKHAGAAGKENKKEDGADGGKKCTCCKGTNIRLLNSKRPGEGDAKKAGNNYVCEDCQEVFK